MTHTSMQNYAIKTYLQDLSRAGVSDILQETAQNAFDTQSLNTQQAKPQALQQENVTLQKPSVKVKKDLQEQRKQDTFIWHLGAKIEHAEIAVICFNKRQDAKEAFNKDTTALFKKMMHAAQINYENIHYILHTETEKQTDDLLKNIPETLPLLIIGQDSSQAVTGKTLTQAGAIPEIKGIQTVGAIPHPHLLLRQPVLKRLAWKNLLTFKEKARRTTL